MSTVPNPAQPSPFALAVDAAVRSEINRLDWTIESLVERAEWLRDMSASGHVPGLGDVRPFRLRPGLADRLNDDGVMDLDDIEVVAFVLGENAVEFARRVISAATHG